MLEEKIKDFRGWCTSQGYRKSTIEAYVRFLKTFPENVVENPKELAYWLEHTGLVPSQLYTAITAAKCYYKSTERKDSAKLLDYPEYSSGEKTLFLSSEQINNYLSSCDKDENVLVSFFLETALRRATVMEVKVSDIDWEKRAVNIDPKYEGNKAAIAITRPLSKQLLEKLSEYISRKKLEQDDSIFRLFYVSPEGTKDPKGGRPLFAYKLYPSKEEYRGVFFEYSNKGDAMKLLIKDVGSRCGLGWVTPHVLRHTYATLFYQSTKDLLATRDSLGHRSTTSTERYAHLVDSLREQHEEVAKQFTDVKRKL